MAESKKQYREHAALHYASALKLLERAQNESLLTAMQAFGTRAAAEAQAGLLAIELSRGEP